MKAYLNSSIGRKQIVAITGILLFGFLFFHLSMNMLIFAGKDAFNFFPNLAHSTGYFLRIMEAGLALIFLTHIYFTIQLVKENRRARNHRYEVENPKRKRSFATKIMPITGITLVVFLIFHIYEFVLGDHHSAAAMINGEAAGLYGLVTNSFKNSVVRSIGYVIAMACVGFHLAHGIQSLFQTFGYTDATSNSTLKKVSIGIGITFGVLFSSIPIYFVFQLCCEAPK